MNRVVRAAEWLCGAMFAVVFAAFCYKIVRRYFAGDAVAWADEVSVVLFVWIVFLANGLVVPERQQIAFDLLVRRAGPRGKAAMMLIRNVLIGGIFLAALPGSLDYIAFLWRERTPVLQWRLDIVYACFGVFMVAVVLRAAVGAWSAVRNR